MSDPRLQRLEELAADRALVGLTSAEELELERLLVETDSTLDAELEEVAALLDRALVPTREPLPPALAARLVESSAHLQKKAKLRPVPRSTPARTGLPAWTGWLAASAAAVVALFLWLGGGDGPDPARLRAALLAGAGTLQRAWSEPGAPTGASGDVVWSQDRQSGVMRIAGLATNDPAVEQYQLWIFDESQEHPVDGGVFDVVAGEVLIPIDAKLPVAKPTLFAVTREKPGGVVVSDQKRIVLVAPI